MLKLKISQSQYKARRTRLLQQLPSGSVAVLPAATHLHRNADAEYPFRQSSDFYYLTGFNEPDGLLLLLPGRPEGEYVLICQPRDPAMEVWTGYRAGPEGCCEMFGADQAFVLDEADEKLPELLDGRRSLYYPMGHSSAFDQRVQGWLATLRKRVRQGCEPPEALLQIDSLLHEMRLIKDEEEVAVMSAAADISAAAHVKAMRQCRPGMMEYMLEACITHHCAMQGARFQAYSPIVGGGANGCILHYIENSAPLRDGDLVLIDAGCELDCYASDITRTFPVNGRFNEQQRALYELVLDTQLQCIDAIRPGVPWNDIHDLSVRVITAGLIRLGLLSGDLDELITSEAYRPFYMHRSGHWLGMDVHDVGSYKQQGEWRPLEPGMVLTVEPGIYVAPDNEAVDPQWRGIGIRIEDDVLVTPEGHAVLTAAVPKTVEAIERLMQEAQ